jgi:DNA repair exonuclease SbcCD nuclease subunit
MRAVVTGDLHFSLYGSDPVMENGLHERLYYIDKVMRDSILKYAIKNKIENCIVAGDIFHNKSIIHSLAMATFVDIIRDFENIHFYLVDGNHDMSKMTGDGVSALKALDKEKNVTVIHDTLTIDNIYMVAWNNQMMKNISKNKNSDYLISHFGLNEGTLSSGISIKSDIGMKDLKNYKYVLLGHYHKPQEIEQNNTQLYYVGSPVQLDRGERHEVKRFLDVDFENNNILSIETEGYKKYFQIELTESDSIDDIVKKAKQLEDDGHEVTLELKGDNLDISRISDDFRMIDKREIDITNRGVSLDMSEEDRLTSFLKIKEIKDIDIYLNVAKEIIGECEHG